MSTFWYVAVVASVTVCVCWYVTPSTTSGLPSLLQVTVVAGPPVDVQMKVLDWSLKVRLVTLGEPAG